MTKLTAAAAAALVNAFNGNGQINGALAATRGKLIAAKCAELTAPDQYGVCQTVITPIGRLRAKHIIRNAG